jgi:hypothetical protein
MSLGFLTRRPGICVLRDPFHLGEHAMSELADFCVGSAIVLAVLFFSSLRS